MAYYYDYSEDSNSDNTNENISSTNSENVFNIYVSGGLRQSPFYNFYLDSAGLQRIGWLSLQKGKTYRFKRLNNLDTHPFFIDLNDLGENISLTGFGSPSKGIIGSDHVDLNLGQNLDVNQTLSYYCTSHNDMKGTISISYVNSLSTYDDDILFGSSQDDFIRLSEGSDSYKGGDGQDVIYGNQGDDLIYGNQKDDILFGGMGMRIIKY